MNVDPDHDCRTRRKLARLSNYLLSYRNATSQFCYCLSYYSRFIFSICQLLPPLITYFAYPLSSIANLLSPFLSFRSILFFFLIPML
ncbi:MAG: hypothetical protein J3R72DRAFT_452394 [Linnemannia gamsii]|nr:MAG: hypothetical protein J3R72DRAFT_452394 [Linnemannia gamsii]